MKIDIQSGLYVVAVSGGVDSMVLLNVVRKIPEVEVVVAHFDHGIREDSHQDRRLVERVAKSYGLNFVTEEGRLGPDASEEKARKSRYDFLRKVKHDCRAKAIITAHHKNDLLETAIHNLLRGTGRWGLIALRSREDILRPLLPYSKTEIVGYAKKHRLSWRDDSTNQNVKYRRNYIRHKILPKFKAQDIEKLEKIISDLNSTHIQIEELLHTELEKHADANTMDRCWFVMLPHMVSREVMVGWLRRNGVKDIDKKLIERLVVAAKTYQNGNAADIDGSNILRVEKNNLSISVRP